MRNKFKEGDRVFAFEIDHQKYYGTIHKNTEHPEVSEFYVKYDDGEECAVIDINSIYHANDFLTYHFNKDKKLVNVESTNEYKPCNLLYVPNAVNLLLKECKGEKEIKIGYDVNKKEEKAFFIQDEEEEFYIECRINISASSYNVCYNRISTIRDNSSLNDGYTNDCVKDEDCNSFESILTGYYDSEKEAYEELKRLSKKYKWFSVGEVLDQNGNNIFCDLYE